MIKAKFGNDPLDNGRDIVIRFASGFDNSRTSCTYVRLLLLAYAWFWTCARSHVRSLFPYDFQTFSGSYIFKLFKNLLLYIWYLIYLFVLGRDRFFTDYICFNETLFFNFLYKLYNKYLLYLPQSTCQFRVSVRK